MGVNLWMCVLIFHVNNAISTHHSKRMSDPLKETGIMFERVIKNMTRVNSELQKLIEKYQSLQENYAVSDISDSKNQAQDSYSDSEGVNENRSIDNTTVTSFSATQMIWEEQNKDKFRDSYADSDSKSDQTNSTEDTSDYAHKNKLNRSEIIFVDTLITQEVRSKTTIPPTAFTVSKHIKNKETKQRLKTKKNSSKDDNNNININHENKGDVIRKTQKGEHKKSYINEKENNANGDNDDQDVKIEKKENDNGGKERESDEDDDQEQTEDDESDKKETGNVKVKNKGKEESSESADSLALANDNLYLQKNRSDTFKQQTKNIKLRSRDNSYKERKKPKVEKKLYSETFSAKKIWEEIIHNEPIRPQVMRKMMTNTNRSKDGKTAIFIITDNNQTQGNHDRATDKATKLRNSYGDACSQVVVRKCYKALKAVIKTICSSFKCKNSYKKKFLEFSKKGCIAQFLGNKTDEDKDDKKKCNGDDDDDIVCRNAKFLDGDDDSHFENPTSQGYMGVCLSHIETQTRGNDVKEPARTLTNHFNILRDRFEKACQEISTKKCTEAGKYATKGICESYHCSNHKKKAFAKTCKRECKYAYQTKSGAASKSSGGSSDTDSSDTSSDTSF